MKKVFFRIDCSNAHGMGHLARTLSLAQELSAVTADLYVYGSDSIDEVGALAQKIFRKIIILPSIEMLDLEDSYDVGVFDFSNRQTIKSGVDWSYYFKKVRISTKKTILIDGLGEDGLYLQNSNIYIDTLVIPYAGAPEIPRFAGSYLKGLKHFVFSRDILDHIDKQNPLPQFQLLISMGGSDPYGMTTRVMSALVGSQSLRPHSVSVIMGPHFSKDLCREISEISRTSHIFQLSEARRGLGGYLVNSQICITAPGLTRYEAARLGCPCMVFCPTESSQKNNQVLSQLGLCVDLGLLSGAADSSLAEKIEAFIADGEAQKKMKLRSSEAFLEHDPQVLIRAIEDL